MFYVCSLPRNCGFPCHSEHGNLHYHLYNESLADPMILTTRYRYGHTENNCHHFQYHGCGGNWNNFFTETECMARCSKIFSLKNKSKFFFK